jgi:hypothetical protein
MHVYCYDPTLITEPKSSHIQNIPMFLGLKTPAFPADNLAFSYRRYLKSPSPQKPAQDMEIKAGIFPGEAIIVEDGK